MSPPHIEELLRGGGRYEPSNLPQLQKNLEEQLETGSYDLEANLAILKLFLLFPNEADVACMEGILLKALMAFPKTNFSLCMYQIPEKYHIQLKEVVHLAEQLEMATFKTFWKEAETVQALERAKGWETAVRNFIAGVVTATYRSIKADVLVELLNISPADLDAMIKEHHWNRSKDDKDIIVVNTASFESACVEPKQASTNMSLDQYKTLFGAASTA